MTYTAIRGKLISKKSTIILSSVLLLGLLSRLYHLGKDSPYRDEIFTALFTSDSVSNYDLGGLITYWFSQGHFPTYFLMMHYWIKLFGRGEFALRLPSVIFGVFSIYLVFLLGKRLFDRKTSLLASYLFAASTASIYYSQYARPYSMVVCFVLLSFLSFLRALERNTPYSWVWYAAITLFTLLLSASALPILICQAFFLAIAWPHYRGRVSLKSAVAAFSLITITYLPFLLKVFLPNIDSGKARPLGALIKPSLGTLVNIFNMFGGQLRIDNVTYAPDYGLSLLKGIFGAVLFLLCLLGVFSAFKAGKKGEPGPAASTDLLPLSGLFLSLWLIIPLALPFIFSYLVVPVFGPERYVLCISPAYYLLISRGIMHFRKKTRILAFICISIAGLLFLGEYYRVEKELDWRQICSYIKNNIKSDEKSAFIMNNFRPISFKEHVMLTYYSAPFIIGIKTGEPPLITTKEERDIYEREVESLKGHSVEELNYGGIWLLTSTFTDYPQVIRKLKDRYDLIERIDIRGATAYHFRIKE